MAVYLPRPLHNQIRAGQRSEMTPRPKPQEHLHDSRAWGGPQLGPGKVLCIFATGSRLFLAQLNASHTVPHVAGAARSLSVSHSKKQAHSSKANLSLQLASQRLRLLQRLLPSGCMGRRAQHFLHCCTSSSLPGLAGAGTRVRLPSDKQPSRGPVQPWHYPAPATLGKCPCWDTAKPGLSRLPAQSRAGTSLQGH